MAREGGGRKEGGPEVGSRGKFLIRRVSRRQRRAGVCRGRGSSGAVTALGGGPSSASPVLQGTAPCGAPSCARAPPTRPGRGSSFVCLVPTGCPAGIQPASAPERRPGRGTESDSGNLAPLRPEPRRGQPRSSPKWPEFLGHLGSDTHDSPTFRENLCLRSR